MCGIAGIIYKNKPADIGLMGKMLSQLAHRGPEDEGTWVSPDQREILGQRRLAIIDLSLGGHQPMVSQDGRFIITFNGEIYNFRELKIELVKKGHDFGSQSDTEVLLAAFVEWGSACLEKLNGMFAFAVWDSKENCLFAARDRLGEKPLKYYWDENKFIFASEVKAILEDETISRDVDWQAVDSALSLRFVAAPATGFKNIKKLPAGHYLVWQDGVLEIKKYWDVGGIKANDDKNLEQWKKEFWELFLDSIKKRMISDVALGAFLSGGLDSTSVVAAMAEVSSRPVETFVISMDGQSSDQKYASLAADFFKTNHHEIEIKEIDYAARLQQLVAYYDEPFFDQSALPSLLISQHIKKYVTVALSGDGGDELFGGYDNYIFARFLSRYQKLPGFLRKKIIPWLMSFTRPASYRAEVLAKDFFTAYADYYSVWKSALPRSRQYLTKEDLYRPEFKKQIKSNFVAEQMRQWFAGESLADSPRGAMTADFKSRLADGYLTKMDIAAMASAVENRPPFLDHRLVELAQSLPSHFKIKGQETKYLWKEIVKNKLPTAIIGRPKAGFSIPLHLIIKNQLKETVQDNILSSDSKISGIFSVVVIQKLWQDHLAGRADYSNHLWSLLILELWLKKYSGK